MLRRFAIITLLTLPALSRAWACSACACGDPTLTVVGVDKPFKGRVRLSTEGRYRYEVTPAEAGTWHSDEVRLDTSVSWAVSNRVVLAATVPVLSTGLQAPNLAWQRGTGLGDIALRARFVTFRSKDQRHLGGVSTGVEMPTAPRFYVDGAAIVDEAQPGTGAWTPELGLWYGGYLGMWSVYTSITGRISAGGFDGRAPGAAGLATVAAQVQPHDKVAVRLSVDGRLQDPDRVQDLVDPDSGGWLVQTVPSLVFSPGMDVLLTLGVAIPLASDLGGGGVEGMSPFLGVVVDL